MKLSFLVMLIFAAGLSSMAQDKYANTYVCTKGRIHFFSSTALEDIDGTSNVALCVVNTQTRKVSVKVKMTSFEFPKKLMEEHFNENYMESDQYPYGILDAVIVQDIDFTKDGIYDVTLKGTFEVHGVKQEREIPGKVTVKNGQFSTATATFDVKLVDHKIKVPKAVTMNIAEMIKVDVAFTFEKYQKN
jgi:hypothetical protein